MIIFQANCDPTPDPPLHTVLVMQLCKDGDAEGLAIW